MNAIKFFLTLITTILLLSCNKSNYNDVIYKRWGIQLPYTLTCDYIVSDQIASHGAISFKISDENKKLLLAQGLEKYGYSQWTELKENFQFGDISLDRKNFFVCAAIDEKKYEYKKVFIGKTIDRIIFVDYNWSGY